MAKSKTVLVVTDEEISSFVTNHNPKATNIFNSSKIKKNNENCAADLRNYMTALSNVILNPNEASVDRAVSAVKYHLLRDVITGKHQYIKPAEKVTDTFNFGEEKFLALEKDLAQHFAPEIGLLRQTQVTQWCKDMGIANSNLAPVDPTEAASVTGLLVRLKNNSQKFFTSQEQKTNPLVTTRQYLERGLGVKILGSAEAHDRLAKNSLERQHYPKLVNSTKELRQELALEISKQYPLALASEDARDHVIEQLEKMKSLRGKKSFAEIATSAKEFIQTNPELQQVLRTAQVIALTDMSQEIIKNARKNPAELMIIPGSKSDRYTPDQSEKLAAELAKLAKKQGTPINQADIRAVFDGLHQKYGLPPLTYSPEAGPKVEPIAASVRPTIPLAYHLQAASKVLPTPSPVPVVDKKWKDPGFVSAFNAAHVGMGVQIQKATTMMFKNGTVEHFGLLMEYRPEFLKSGFMQNSDYYKKTKSEYRFSNQNFVNEYVTKWQPEQNRSAAESIPTMDGRDDVDAASESSDPSSQIKGARAHAPHRTQSGGRGMGDNRPPRPDKPEYLKDKPIEKSGGSEVIL